MRFRLWLTSLVTALAIAAGVYANDYYTHGSFPSAGSPATSASMRAELDLISAGFDKLTTITGNANKAVIINGSGTAQTVTAGTLALAGNFSLIGASSVSVTSTAPTTLTLPVTGTLTTLNGSEVFTNKTFNLASNTLTGTTAQFNTALSDNDFATLSGAENLSNKTITSPVLSGTATGSYTLASPGFSGTATGSLTSLVLTTSTVSAAPTTSLGIANKDYADQHGFTTGDVKLTLKTVADTSWVLMDDTTIGNGSSGASGRANADTVDLFTVIWNNVTDTWAPVSGGRGASAAADYAANKTIALPKTLGRALAGYGTGTVVATALDADVDITANTIAVPSNNAKWVTGMQVSVSYNSGSITGLSGGTYYIYRNSATTIRFASTLANAQNATLIDFTAKSSPDVVITHTYTARVLGEAVGEQDHAMSLTEMVAHTHPPGGGTNFMNIGGSADFQLDFDPELSVDQTTVTGSRGGNAAMNITNPTLYLTVMVKL